MKKIPFYILNNNLHKMSYINYLNHLKKNVLSQDWFKKACKEKKIRISYLSKNIFFKNLKNSYLKYNQNTIYFFKLFLLKFEYEELENNNHLKLLNINIKNETTFKITKLLFSLQKSFLKTNHYQDINIISRKDFVTEYIRRYKSYLDLSILCNILNTIQYLYNNNIQKLSFLIPKKNYVYSLYIKDLINSNVKILKGDSDLSKILYSKYKILIPRRRICTIRNKYLISPIEKKTKFDFYLYHERFYDIKRKLNKRNISLLNKNTTGIYELSSSKDNKYPFSRNNIIYIGSSSNIKKRLLTYSSKNAHTENIRQFFKKNENIYFRIIQTLDYKQFEMLFINSFIEINGKLPKLNTQRVLNI